MPLVQIPVGITPQQVDDFPTEVDDGKGGARPFARSCKGSLRLRPASTKVLTDDELKWLTEQKQWAHIGTRMNVVDVKTVTDDSDRSTAKPKPGGPVEKAMAKAAVELAKTKKQPKKPAPATKPPPAAAPKPETTASTDTDSDKPSRRGGRRGG